MSWDDDNLTRVCILESEGSDTEPESTKLEASIRSCMLESEGSDTEPECPKLEAPIRSSSYDNRIAKSLGLVGLGSDM